MVYAAADIPIDAPSDSALSTRSRLIGTLSSLIPIFQAQKEIIKMTILDHFQVVDSNYEKVSGGKWYNSVKRVIVDHNCYIIYVYYNNYLWVIEYDERISGS